MNELRLPFRTTAVDVLIAGLRPEILFKPRLNGDLKPKDFKRMDEAIDLDTARRSRTSMREASEAINMMAR